MLTYSIRKQVTFPCDEK